MQSYSRRQGLFSFLFIYTYHRNDTVGNRQSGVIFFVQSAEVFVLPGKDAQAFGSL